MAISREMENTIKEKVREIQDFPKQGILFYDITPLLRDGPTFCRCVDELARGFEGAEVDYIASIEARGFWVGPPLAYSLKAGFIPLRKPGKLPYKTVSAAYALEYGEDRIHMHEDAVEPDSNVLVVDDVIATGGTAAAAASMIESQGANVVGLAFLIELQGLKGIEKLEGRKVFSLLKY
jgi:adenine phosphoribosyltransferase